MFRWAWAAACLLLTLTAAPATAASLDDYGAYPSMEMVKLSPSGDRYAYVGRSGDRRKLFVYALSGDPVRVVDLGTYKARAMRWVGEDRILLTLSQTERLLGAEWVSQSYELAQVSIINVATGAQTWVFAREAGVKVAQAVFGDYGVARIGDGWFAYYGGVSLEQQTGALIGGEMDHGYADLWRIDVASGLAHRVDMGDARRSIHWLVDPQGRVIARSIYEDESGQWRLLGHDPGEETQAGPVTEHLLARNDRDTFDESDVVGLGRTAGTAIYETVDDNKMGHIYEVSLKGGQPTELFAGERVVSLLFDDQSRLLVGAVIRRARDETRLFAPALQARLDAIVKAFPDRALTLESWTPDFGKVVALTEGPHDAGTYWLIDMKTLHADILGERHEGIAPEDVGAVRMFAYKAADGLAMEGVLTLPPGRPAKGLPVVVLPHGGPAARDDISFDWWAQAFARLGYAVFQPNFRGSEGYGDAFRVAGYGEWGRKMQTDISDGLAALSAEGIVDPRRACIMGGSYGGYAALAGVTIQHGLYRCAVSVAGVSDLGELLRYESDRGGWSSPAVRYWRNYMGLEGKTGYTDPALQAISPASLAAKADAPILLIHGDKDTVVPIDQSQIMQTQLQRAGKPVEMVVLPSEDHWLSQQETRVAMLKAAAAFIQKLNPPN